MTRNKEGRNTAWPLFMQHKSGFFNAVKAANSRANEHASAITLILGFQLNARVFKRKFCRCHTINNEGANALLLFGIHPFISIKAAINRGAKRQGAGNLAGQIRDIKAGDWLGTAHATDKVFPSKLSANSKRRNNAKTSYHHTSHAHTERFPKYN